MENSTTKSNTNTNTGEDEQQQQLVQVKQKRKKAHLKLRFNDVTKDNVGQLRLLNMTVFPVRYNDKFYRDVVSQNDSELIRLGYHSDLLVGAVCCRIEDCPPKEDPPKDKSDKRPQRPQRQDPDEKRLYIMTLGVLAPYRGYGVGKRMLEHIIDVVRHRENLNEIYLHVQVSNKGAIAFYEKFNFKIVSRLKDYYKRIDPPDCFVVARKFTADEKIRKPPPSEHDHGSCGHSHGHGGHGHSHGHD